MTKEELEAQLERKRSERQREQDRQRLARLTFHEAVALGCAWREVIKN